ncbi:peptide-methionine (S)-S-oxide reductase MsrA [Rubritalea spongiae]|uniref:Peptide methionine sulfoxide reductase MsrA n=1 Tax=Rubritalea spongiae TaxID=430797 RepID=A0ABW5E4H5_9BACT
MMKPKSIAILAVLGIAATLFFNKQQAMSADKSPAKMPEIPEGHEQISLGAGCFWCVEAVYNRLDGVKSAVSGYTGGQLENPTYTDICTGTTGHAEVVHLVYDPEKVSTKTILAWFWKAHDPTTLNRQGNDIGTQYRSAIYYYTDAQKAAAEASLKEAQKDFKSPIVTEITKASTFYPAEIYHQDYYRINGQKNGYCRAIIAPKIKKLGLEDKAKVAE